MFHHRQQLRRWAARVLILWLFGVAASVTNACLTTVQTVPVASAASHQAGTLGTAHETTPHQHEQVDVGALPTDSGDATAHHGGLAKTYCQDFCSKATVTIPPLKSALDDVQSHALVVMATTVALPMPAFASVQLWVPRRDGVRAPPIPIAFLRLAL
jgi:hypothetical protein